MNRFRPLRRLLASALGILLLQAFLAPGDLACALRHHAADGSAAATAPAHDAAGHGDHDAGHGAALPAASHGAGATAPATGDHCADPARHHCAWMSACAPVAVMAPVPSFVPARPLARLAPQIAAPARPPVVALRPEVPPPRG